MGKIIAITGINGYFASTLLPKLQTDPEVDKIIGIDINDFKGEDASKVEFFREDVRSPRLAEIVSGVDALFHLAFIVGEIRDKAKTHDINVNGSRNVFKACISNGIPKVIYTSSMTAYGAHPENPPVLNEDCPLHPNEDSYYNLEKIEVERLARECFKDHPEICLTILRVALAVGPRMDNMFSEVWTRFPITFLVRGSDAQIQCIHEKDLAEALYTSCLLNLSGVFNVGANDSVPLRWCLKKLGVSAIELPEKILKPIVGLGFRLNLFPAGRGWVSLSAHKIFGDCTKFKMASGWCPQFTSKEAFLTYVQKKS